MGDGQESPRQEGHARARSAAEGLVSEVRMRVNGNDTRVEVEPRVSLLRSAIDAFAAAPNAAYLGGGTNLVDLMREGVEAPDRWSTSQACR